MKERSFADQFGDVVGDAQAGALDALGSHSTGYGRREADVNQARSCLLGTIELAVELEDDSLSTFSAQMSHDRKIL